MFVGRNDLCPCGSGKKYKKCCMNKDRVTEISRVRQERFFQLKTELIEKIQGFLGEKLSFFEHYNVKKAFHRELKPLKNKDRLEHFLPVWSVLFYRYKNGLRGIEWFYEENKGKLSNEERNMVETWMALVPRLVQIVDKEEAGVIVEDRFTSQQLFMPFCETMYEAVPWGGIFSFIEPFGEGHYIHGLTFIESPDGVERAYKQIIQRLAETGASYEQVVFTSFFAILDHMIGDPPSGKKIKKERVTLHYHVNDVKQLTRSLLEKNVIIIDEESDGYIELSLVGQEVKYEDNVVDGPIYIRQVFGYIDIENNKLRFQSLDVDATDRFKQLMSEERVPLIKETADKVDVPEGVELATYAVHVADGIPSYMGAIAQEMVLAYESLHRPVLDGKTPMEWLESGSLERVERWLRQREYASFMAFASKTGGITPDYNSIRRKLRLPLSPFVTLGEGRQSRMHTLKPLEHTSHSHLQMPFDWAAYFFGSDLLAFFEEKAVGKSAETQQKYRVGIAVLADYFKTKHYASWEEVSENDWHECIVYFYLKTYRDISVHQAKRFISTCKAFAKWLDRKYGTEHAQSVSKITQETEEEVYQAIRLFDKYQPYWSRKNPIWSVVRNLPREKHVYQIVSVSSTVMLRAIDTNDTHRINIPPSLRGFMKKGMFIVCSLMYTEDGKRMIHYVDTVFPEAAAAYMPAYIQEKKRLPIN
ncbi:YecA family protein [Anoxybacteroides amylolyticum]|uniref:SEC-C motif family protein n=1 Tax=Anoxybacteroides amylolyticum TaxID=294699 RepID=A0A160F679_9BACL|nr:SEC-C domain-containing protein [Anoxybacillus amylolyticus]ANB61313.1 SEC-C motif family protein [Anoxybacillus amylolyticus]